MSQSFTWRSGRLDLILSEKDVPACFHANLYVPEHPQKRAGNGIGELLAVREKGVVKWFNSAKGYGFIQRSSGEDVFVHFSAIDMSGYRTLEEGAEVEFEVKTGPKGLQAENVNRP